jgi:hypothetical protein
MEAIAGRAGIECRRISVTQLVSGEAYSAMAYTRSACSDKQEC